MKRTASNGWDYYVVPSKLISWLLVTTYGLAGRPFLFCVSTLTRLNKAVRQPTSTQLLDLITFQEAREQEKQFFETTPAWATLESRFQSRLGTANLQAALSDTLAKRISDQLCAFPDRARLTLPLTNQ